MSLKELAQKIREIVAALEDAPHEVITEIHDRFHGTTPPNVLSIKDEQTAHTGDQAVS